jgi:lipopolysaccharide transport protein LptA
MAILFPERQRPMRRAALALAAVLAVALLTGATGAPKTDPKETITVEAGSSDVDAKTHLMHLHKGVKISRGDLSVEAEEAVTTGTDSKDSHWVFTGKVHVRSESKGDVYGDRATVEITGGALANALVTGSPAQFEQAHTTQGRLAKGHAASIDYDVVAGTVKLNGDSWLSDELTGDETRGPTITYNVREQKIEADGGAVAGGRVHMKIIPGSAPAPDAEQGKP